MTSGLKWEEWNVPYDHPGNDLGIIVGSEDPISYVLSRPLEYEPGKRFKHNSGGIIVLSEIIKTATKMNLDEFSFFRLLSKIGLVPIGVKRYKS